MKDYNMKQTELQTYKPIEQQIGEALETETKVADLLNKLDLNTDRQNWLKLYIYRRIKGISTYEELRSHDLPFFQEPIPKKRTFNYYVKDKRVHLNLIAEKILRIATERNIVLDLNIVKKEKTKLHESVKLIKKLIYPQIDFKIGKTAMFSTKDLLDVLVYIAWQGDFINNGTNTFSELYPDTKVPSSDTLLYHLNKFKDITEIKDMFDKLFSFIFTFAKRNYNILNRKVDIAIDVHDRPYYGDKSDPYVVGGKPDRGTTNFFKFITCSIVVGGRRFALNAIPVHPFDNLSELVDKLLKDAKSKVSINHVYLDRGFDRVEVINVLKKNHVDFVMPKIKSETVKAWFDKSEDCKSRVIKNFDIGGRTTVNLILVDDDEGIKRAFSTNIDIPEQMAHYLFKLYSKRWGIETCYRGLENDFMARTTSKNYSIRFFYFMFSLCLHNLWVLVNICVSLMMYGRVMENPIITTRMFAAVLYRAYVDVG